MANMLQRRPVVASGIRGWRTVAMAVARWLLSVLRSDPENWQRWRRLMVTWRGVNGVLLMARAGDIVFDDGVVGMRSGVFNCYGLKSVFDQLT
jgi:hypothetical protein